MWHVVEVEEFSRVAQNRVEESNGDGSICCYKELKVNGVVSKREVVFKLQRHVRKQ
jgi:hypothetical protein